MKAVNLLPDGARRSGGSLRELSPSTAGLLGALTLGLVLVASWVLLSNSVTSRQDKLADLGRQQAAAERQVAELKPYADLEQLRQSLLEKVRTLADGRYDWPTALDRLARAFPADTTLKSFDGNPGGAGGTSGASGGPTVLLTGCTPSHDDVAQLIDRLRAVRGVLGVSLQSSTVAKDNDETNNCPEEFKLTVQLKAAAVAAATAPATGATPATPAPAGATPATPSPTPAPATGAPTASAGTPTGGAS
jgi:Tfp pilus assembly protein PilN